MKGAVTFAVIGAAFGLITGHPGIGALIGLAIWAWPKVERTLDGLLRVAFDLAGIVAVVVIVGLAASHGG